MIRVRRLVNMTCRDAYSSPTDSVADRQLHLLDGSVSPIVRGMAGASQPPRAASGRDRVSVDLRDVGPSLRRHAALERVPAAVLIRRALLSTYGADAQARQKEEKEGACDPPGKGGGPIVKVTLRMSSGHAEALATRARASDLAQGDYVCALLDGTPPQPLPAGHEATVQAVRVSTDHLGALSADLSAFLRLLGHVPAPELEPFRARLSTLVDDVRTHLALSAALLAELGPRKRARR